MGGVSFSLRILFVVIGVTNGCQLNHDYLEVPQYEFQIGREVQLTTSASDDFYPVWSHDGQNIAFISTRSGNWDIWMMNNDGTDQQQMTTHPSFDAAPAWSPDGRTVAFTSKRFSAQGIPQLLLMDREGVTSKLISDNTNSKQLIPAWSPSGAELAVLTQPMHEPAHWELHLIDLLTLETNILVKEHVAFAPYSWHPDGRTITFVRRPGEKLELWSITREGTDLEPVLVDQTNNSDPHWSSDGNTLVFTSDRSGHSEVWVLALMNHQLQQLSFHRATARYPRWNHDSTEIAFTSNRSGNDDIWVMSVNSY